jgi:leucyl aminopeptidase
MEIEVSRGPIDSFSHDTIGVAVVEPADRLPAAIQDLQPLVDSGEAPAERGVARLVHVNGLRVAAAGLGPREMIDADAIRDAAAAAAREVERSVGGSIAWLLDPELLAPEEQVRAIVEGIVIGGYDPGEWKSHNDRKSIERLTVVADQDVGEAARRARVVADWTNHARELANRPPNDLTPARLAEHAAGIASRFDSLVASVLGPEEMATRGMGAILAVGQGSQNEPRMILLRHEPAAPTRPDVVLGLVGKGVTFDTGGISLKKREYMEDMKGDMAGGGAVVAAMGAIAELGLPVRAIGVVGAAENMPGGASFRPGDILTAMNGKTIEVTDTDAEGRIVLADALVYAREEGATHLLDLATLTGAIERALGDVYAGVFGNDPEWRDQVAAAGEASGDHAWSLPMHARFHRFIESAYADMKNHNLRNQASPAYAAEFLREFAGEGPWAHIDMAGTGFLTWSRGDYLSQKGGTGYGVRLIVELASRLSEPAG